jgi:MFS family permease
MLAASYGISYLDRNIFMLLSPAIKSEFRLHDWQIGLAAGPAFALTFAIGGLPLALLSDKHSRQRIIAASMAVFSAATIFCGAAVSFAQLAVGRVITGAGEAGVTPAAHSMIADLYPPARRASALSFFAAGGICGGMVANLVGGYVAHHYGWRATFWISGIAGFVFVLLILAFVREPARIAAKPSEVETPPSSWDVLRQLSSQRTVRWLALGVSLVVLQSASAGSFFSVFLVQTHDMNLQQIGFIKSLLDLPAIGVTVLVGTFADRWGSKDLRNYAYIAAMISLFVVPFTIVFVSASSIYLVLAIGLLPRLVGLAYQAPVFAMLHLLVPNRMRARSLAVFLLFITLAGSSVGPFLTGVLSDLFALRLGEAEGLRWALGTMVLANVVGAFAFYKAAGSLVADVNKLQDA